MSAYTHDCPPEDCGPCGTLPPGFVRLRYFYGKRLGVVDFIDEQRYHAGKLRFHNQRLHGAGVLCGLGASLFTAGETVLRIGKGAAVDACGREIVVGYDQCIDVDAWFGRWRAEQLADDPAWTPPLEDGELRLCVALRFRECPAGVEPAPRDPCACDATGSDYGRVREEFQLDLLVHADVAAHRAPAIAPPRADLELALARAVGGGELAGKLRDLLHVGCAEAEPDSWLVLACFAAELDAAGEHVVAIDHLASTAAMLYSSALIEELLEHSLAATLEAGAWTTGGPEVSGLAFARATNDELKIALTAPIVEPTAVNATYELRAFDPTTGWSSPGIPVGVTYAASPPVITVGFAVNLFAEDRLYRLAVIAPDEPIVDAEMRPLRPLRPSFHFRIVDDGGLVVAPAPYAEATP